MSRDFFVLKGDEQIFAFRQTVECVRSVAADPTLLSDALSRLPNGTVDGEGRLDAAYIAMMIKALDASEVPSLVCDDP